MDTDRAAYIAGLRQLADILDNNPSLPLPYDGNGTGLMWIRGGSHASPEQTLEEARLFTRLIPGKINKKVRGDALDLIGRIAGLRVQMITERDAVCERIVTGTRQVTIPAEPASAAQPAHVETVEDVEWHCGSLLTGKTVA